MKSKCLLFIAAVLLGTATSFAQKSRKSVEQFLVAVSTIENVSKEDYIKRLRPLIDPQANADSLCADFYLNWKSNYDAGNRQLSYTLEQLVENGDTATATVTSIWMITDWGKYRFTSVATWVRRKGRWYRSGEISQRTEAVKLED